MKAPLLLCLLATVILSVTGASLPHRHRRHRHDRSRKQFVQLQDSIDTLLLQQKIDNILLSNLQKAVQSLQEKEALSEAKELSSREALSSSSFGSGLGEEKQALSALSSSVSGLEEEQKALKALREEAARVRDTVKEVLLTEERQDEVNLIRQELDYLRSEVQRLKETRASDSARTSAQSEGQAQREAVTGTWVIENVRRLQDSVVELQQALNVTQAMHDKQEVESRLTVVTKDVAALRGSMAAVRSKAEAAAAVSEALTEDLTRTTEDFHRAAGQSGALSTKVSDLREDFNHLLSALPEGTLAGTATAASPSGHADKVSVAAAAVVTAAAETRRDQRLADLEQRTDKLDFAITRAQKQLSSLVPGSAKEERVAQLAETERQLERKVEAARTGVVEVRSSSVQLLAALEALEAKMEKQETEVKQEVAKLEFKVAEATADQQSGKRDVRVAHDDTSALRTDLQAVSRRLDHFTLKMATLEGSKLEDDVALAQCRAQHLTLDLKVNDTLARLKTVEDEGRSRKDGHKHHLRPWRSTKSSSSRTRQSDSTSG